MTRKPNINDEILNGMKLPMNLKIRFKKLMNKNLYLNISSERITAEINSIIVQYSEIKPEDEQNIYNELVKFYDNYIKKQLSDDTKSKKLINSFIQHRLNDNPNENELIMELHKLKNFLSNYDFQADVEVCLYLLNNPTIESIVSKLFNKYSICFLMQDYTPISDDYFVTSLIESYCLINKIETRQYNDDEEELEYEEDTVKYDSMRIYMSELDGELLTEEKELDLIKRTKNGDELAKNELVKKNLRLVVSIAKRYINRGIDLPDLIQEGNIGLLKAIDRFDTAKGCRFSTYATIWIKQTISRSISNNSRIIRIPIQTGNKIIRCAVVSNNFEEKYGRKPTDEELAELTGLTVDDITRTKSVNCEIVSLNKIISEEDQDTELGDLIANESANVEQTAEKNILALELQQLFESTNLSEKEIIILTKRFGLDGQEPLTLDATGKIFNVSRERIRQIEEKALKKLRRNPKTKSFRAYIINDEQTFTPVLKSRRMKKETITIETPEEIKEPTQNNYSNVLNNVDIIENMSIEDKIFALYTGYFTKRYTIEEISNIIKLPSLDVLEILKKQTLELKKAQIGSQTLKLKKD